MAYENFKDIPRITNYDKVLPCKAVNIVETPKHDRYQHGIVSVFYKILIEIWLVLLLNQGKELILKINKK